MVCASMCFYEATLALLYRKTAVKEMALLGCPRKDCNTGGKHQWFILNRLQFVGNE